MARRLNVPALGIAIGVIWGVCLLLMTWLNALTGGIEAPYGWFYPIVKGVVWTYPWYGPSLLGGIWGGVIGFVDGLIGGVLVALIYNRLATPIEEESEPAESDEGE